jgi:uroporphyrin-III C-methyltransferase
MIDGARAGQSVLRLKSGDPLIFGRAGEEIAELEAAGIPIEIVPGITAAFAAASRLQTALTDRNSASRLILATAHHAADKLHRDTDPNPIWSGSLPEEATLVIYMPGRDFEALAARLIDRGISERTPCVAISHVTRASEQVYATTLGDLHNEKVGPAPVILLVGHAIQPRA